MQRNKRRMMPVAEREAQWTKIWKWNQAHGHKVMDSDRYALLKQRLKPNRAERRELARTEKKDQPHKRRVPFRWGA